METRQGNHQKLWSGACSRGEHGRPTQEWQEMMCGQLGGAGSGGELQAGIPEFGLSMQQKAIGSL